MITDWTPIIVTAITALGGIVGAYFTSRAAGRAAAQKEQGDLAGRVTKLETEEATDVRAAREEAARAIGEARTAAESAERIAGDLKRHLDEERERRREGREIGQKRDSEVAQKVERLAEKVTTLAAQTELLLDGRVDLSGGLRRGR